jgi:hypothetical protein
MAASISETHFERAMRLVQKAFMDRIQLLDSYLYFNHHSLGVTGTSRKILIFRGLTGGGPKSILVLINSAAIGILIYKLSDILGIKFIYRSVDFIVLVLVFLAAAFLHIVYASWLYKVNGIK